MSVNNQVFVTLSLIGLSPISSVYQTEKYIEKAIREEGLQREELYITTKYDGGFVRRELEGSLKRVRNL